MRRPAALTVSATRHGRACGSSRRETVSNMTNASDTSDVFVAAQVPYERYMN
jgi:hypothetical protein